jgi:uncharacterized membrane protein
VTSVGLATAAAVAWGCADYCGGKATRHTSALAVTVASQLLGLPVLALCAVLLTGQPTGADLRWGMAAGAAELGGFVALYKALAGQMSVTMPISAVTATLVPMTLGLVIGRIPPAHGLIGAVCALVAIPLISAGRADSTPHRGRGDVSLGPAMTAVLAGSLFGTYLSLLSRTSPGSGMWPFLAARMVSIAVGLLVVAYRRTPWRVPHAANRWIALVSIGEIVANGFYLLAVRSGLLSTVAPIVGLSPIFTVLLALVIDREPLRPIQVGGLVVAMIALILTAV